MGILTSYNGWEDKTGYLIGNTRYFENLLANQNGYIVSINHNDTCLFGPSSKSISNYTYYAGTDPIAIDIDYGSIKEICSDLKM